MLNLGCNLGNKNEAYGNSFKVGKVEKNSDKK